MPPRREAGKRSVTRSGLGGCTRLVQSCQVYLPGSGGRFWALRSGFGQSMLFS